MKDRDFLMWIHERLEHVYKENPLLDYMHKLRAIIADTPEDRETPNDGRGESCLENLKKALIKKHEQEEEDNRPLTQKELYYIGLTGCEQCGEIAWDGRICHACGAKNI